MQTVSQFLQVLVMVLIPKVDLPFGRGLKYTVVFEVLSVDNMQVEFPKKELIPVNGTYVWMNKSKNQVSSLL
jgi:hypothetical protein